MIREALCRACQNERYDEDGYLKDLEESGFTCKHCNNEGWIKVGPDAIVYLNVYTVSRHYGGPEEGGWYYNQYNCIEVFPVKNKLADMMREELESEHASKKYGNIYSVLGGRDIDVRLEATPKESETRERPYYC
jgi:hypothetical protein